MSPAATFTISPRLITRALVGVLVAMGVEIADRLRKLGQRLPSLRAQEIPDLGHDLPRFADPPKLDSKWTMRQDMFRQIPEI